ncbi:PQQ-dependent sugar dehydrogenase [Massilia sp. H6]|uniref:PQQ-dependent sugar dehydrogenase n=1 Tax=Massilia sp. H6 TaxID=2970464 RepID=UPI002169EF4C|nr:PQQ-dependent sugar dehydrogenase [Massilia sp. H6]UVW29251.1 PQQ-dependent sugar dehydrogenase [Massilia sp. H6]
MTSSQRIPARALISVVTLFTVFSGPVAAQPVTPVDEPPAAKGWRLDTVVGGLPQPWGMAWLADGRMLVTGKKGTLHLVKGKRVDEIAIESLPALFTGGQGGLLDIAVHPHDRGANPRVYMTMASGTQEDNRTVLVQGVFDGKRVHGVKTLFTASPSKSGGQHFGSRILFLKDGTILMSIGDGGNPPQRVGSMLAREQAQNLGSHYGAVLHLGADGKPAAGNPLAGQQGALPELWSIGHRNIQGMAVDLQSGRVWASEHGPRGGDEINLIEGGKNYGWPLQSYGLDYSSREPVGTRTVPGMVQPIVVWSPSPAPSGLVYYTGKAFPAWRGSLFSGSLAGQDVRRVALDAHGKVTRQEKLAIGKRVRDVRQGPDGHLYVLTDEAKGSVLRIMPK